VPVRGSDDEAIDPKERHAEALSDLRRSVFDAMGSTTTATRVAAAEGVGVPRQLESYVAAVHEESYRLTDADVGKLKSDGLTEDEIFEVTIAAALGRSLNGLETALRAMRNGAS
jgi:hypothetical protein